MGNPQIQSLVNESSSRPESWLVIGDESQGGSVGRDAVAQRRAGMRHRMRFDAQTVDLPRPVRASRNVTRAGSSETSIGNSGAERYRLTRSFRGSAPDEGGPQTDTSQSGS